MKLPPPPSTFTAAYVAQINRLIETAVAQRYVKGEDVGVYQPAKLIVADAQFLTGLNHTPSLGSLSWDDTNQTLDIGMDYGVVQQVGMETYARVQNSTGVTIPNGTVVGFSGVGTANTLKVTPYLADGSTPTLYILGVMTHDLPDSGEVGYCTTWGHVRDVNTSAFSVGDILYASPTTAGGFTNVKPTAPDNVVPVAAVLKVGTTDGEIFVRPTIEQQQYYGVFSDTANKTAAAIYTPYAIALNTTDFSNGFSRGSPTSRVVAAQSGLYNFQFSAQVSSSSSNSQKLWLWPRINGVDVPNSGSEITVAGNSTVLVPAWNWVLSLDANDYFELVYAVDSTNVRIVSVAAQTGANGTATFARPAVPSIILTVTQVQQ